MAYRLSQGTSVLHGKSESDGETAQPEQRRRLGGAVRAVCVLLRSSSEKEMDILGQEYRNGNTSITSPLSLSLSPHQPRDEPNSET